MVYGKNEIAISVDAMGLGKHGEVFKCRWISQTMTV
jgi:hypothetical protein